MALFSRMIEGWEWRSWLPKRKKMQDQNPTRRPGHPPARGKDFDRARTNSYTDGIEVKLSPQLQAKPESIAAQQGRDSAALVHEAVERLIGYDEWFLRQAEEGLAQIDRGEVLEHDEVAARMEKLIAEKQRHS